MSEPALLSQRQGFLQQSGDHIHVDVPAIAQMQWHPAECPSPERGDVVSIRLLKVEGVWSLVCITPLWYGTAPSLMK